MRSKNKKNYFVLVLLFLVCISIGYAVLNTTLNITGKSSISKNTWNVHFENVQITTGSVEAKKVPTIENDTTVDFEVGLNLPGDFYEFTVDVVNGGSIDAMIESITKEPELTEDQKKYLNYIVEYQNGEQLATKQLVKSNEFVRIKVKLEIKADVASEDLPEVGDVLYFGFTLNYVQADDSGVLVKDNGKSKIASANGSLDDIGTIVTIGTEQFYTIGTEGDNVKLLSMYNLYVGGYDDVENDTWVPYGDEATGMQDENMLGYGGYNSTEKVFHGTTSFYYPIEYVDDPFAIPETYTYSGSIVAEYVNNYKNLLESNFEISIIEARILKTEEVFYSDIFGCTSMGFCPDTYPWIYATSYWVGTETSEHKEVVARNGETFYETLTSATSGERKFGVRPVIVIPKSEIAVPEIKPVANGDVNEIGTIVTIGTEKFYTIGTEGDNVKLLSMYNLHVGNDASSFTVTPLLNPTGKQHSTSGVTPFSSEEKHGVAYGDYAGSIAEEYVNNYKDLLEETYKIDINEARLITYDELTDPETFACEEYAVCAGNYSWIHSTVYWTGTNYSGDCVWVISTGGNFGDYFFDTADSVGVRPVIVISKDYFE